MANHIVFRASSPLVEDDIRRPLGVLAEGVLKGRVRIEEEENGAWRLHHPRHNPDEPVPTMWLDDEGALRWAHLPGIADWWILQCVACQVVRSIDPSAMLEDDGVEEAFPADFDRRYPTLMGYVDRPTGSRLLDGIRRVVGGKDLDDGIRMASAPF